MSGRLTSAVLPQGVIDLLLKFLKSKHGAGDLRVQPYRPRDNEKSAGAKAIWRVFYQQGNMIHRYYLKIATQEREMLQGDEDLITGIRLAQHSDAEWAITAVMDEHIGKYAYAAGTPFQVFVLEEHKDGRLLADILHSMNMSQAFELADAVVRWLAEKQTPVSERSHQYVRELFGGPYGILATIDYFPPRWLSEEIAQRFARYALRWRPVLQKRPMVRIHGDFHPWNIFFDMDRCEIETTGALHTPFGAPEDDWCCLGVNLAHIAAQKATSPDALIRTPQWRMLELLEASASQVETWASGFFCGWRLMIIANPRHYPHLSEQTRERLVRGALWCLRDPKRNKGGLVTLLKSVFAGNPWIREQPQLYVPALPSCVGISRRHVRQVAVSEAREMAKKRGKDNGNNNRDDERRIAVSGQVHGIRRHGGVTFIDLESTEEYDYDSISTVQVIAQRTRMGNAYAELIGSLRHFDRIQVIGIPVMSRTGEPSVDAEWVEWLSHNLAPLEVAKQFSKKAQIACYVSRVLRVVRDVLREFGFQEIWTPSVQRAYNGGMAYPFETFRRHDRRDCYLRVTMELLHKELLVGGISRIYEIGSSFRNESRDRSHLPEFLMLEAYACNKSLAWMEMISLEIVKRSWADIRTEQFPMVETLTVAEAMRKFLGIDLHDRTLSKRQIESLSGLSIHNEADFNRAVYALLRNKIRGYLKGVYLLREIPPEPTPLISKRHSSTRTWLHMAGTNIADICVEETRPDVVKERFTRQQERTRLIVHRDDRSFLSGLMVGLPPTVGMGMSLSRLVQVLAGMDDIRETEWWAIREEGISP